MVFEAPALVASFDDLAMMREAVQQGRAHLGIAGFDRPFAEGEIRGGDDGGALVQATDEMEEQLATGLRKRKIAKLVRYDQVDVGEIFR